jgi:nicotinate-nucleotide pyrophosphorylase (carboxylating)
MAPRLRLKPLEPLLQQALQEDLGTGDVTSAAVLAPGQRLRGRFVAKEVLTVAGLPLLSPLYRFAGGGVAVRRQAAEGAVVRRGAVLATVSGRAASLMAAERTILNFLQRLSGTATLTRAFVKAARPHRVAIMDTRKTTPCWRVLDKYAVAVGGGAPHRKGLYDQVLLKENHLRALAARLDDPRHAIRAAIERARRTAPAGTPVEIETRTLREFDAALAAGADIIMVDNAGPRFLRAALARRRGRKVQVEVSGGITLANVARVARLRPDRISIGALTHSAPAADISFLVATEEG